MTNDAERAALVEDEARRSELCDFVSALALSALEELGAGHHEEPYKNALAVRLQRAGVVALTEFPVQIVSRVDGIAFVVGVGRVDIWLPEQRLAIECKCGPLEPSSAKFHQWNAQVRKYLRELAGSWGVVVLFGWEGPELQFGPSTIRLSEWQVGHEPSDREYLLRKLAFNEGDLPARRSAHSDPITMGELARRIESARPHAPNARQT